MRPVRGLPTVVEIHDSEEKGSDVNLAVHLLHDGWRSVYDVAVVVSNDTDLCEAIRLVTEHLKKPVGVICPATNCAKSLADVASFVRFLNRSRLRKAQFPTTIPGTKITKPSSW